MIDEPTSSSWSVRLAFVLSAALAALALRYAWEEPLLGAVALAIVAATVATRWLSRRRAHALLRSGDVQSILQRWASSFNRIPHPETMAPLMAATAFAAYGWTSRAREVLQSAERGAAWEAALEHRLFVDTLLLTFEGDSEEALKRASTLSQLPMPTAVPFLVERVKVLRGAVAALARAFSHQSESGDLDLLIDAGNHSPLVHWAMRYGAAVVSIDAGDVGRARALIAGAPGWPSESCFSAFHREIEAELGRRAKVGADSDGMTPAEHD